MRESFRARRPEPAWFRDRHRGRLADKSWAKPRRSQSRQRADSSLTPFIPSAKGAEFVRLAEFSDARTRKNGDAQSSPSRHECSHTTDLPSARSPTLEPKILRAEPVAIRALPVIHPH